jgi:hypothetical protein
MNMIEVNVYMRADSTTIRVTSSRSNRRDFATLRMRHEIILVQRMFSVMLHTRNASVNGITSSWKYTPVLWAPTLKTEAQHETELPITSRQGNAMKRQFRELTTHVRYTSTLSPRKLITG